MESRVARCAAAALGVGLSLAALRRWALARRVATRTAASCSRTGATPGSTVPPHTASKQAPFTGRKARVAVLGCGGWTQGWHLPNLGNRADTEIVAVIDPCEHPGAGGCVPGLCKPMPEVATRYGARWYTSLEAVLAAKEELELDGVLCAAPHHLHHAIGTAVLQAGLHLLMEKPITADVDEARDLFDLARSRRFQARLVIYTHACTCTYTCPPSATRPSSSTTRGMHIHSTCIYTAHAYAQHMHMHAGLPGQQHGQLAAGVGGGAPGLRGREVRRDQACLRSVRGATRVAFR